MSATVSIEAWEDEKARRIYYQNIVYDVCNKLDRIFAKKPGHGVVCGTLDSPTSQVQAAMEIVEHRCTEWAKIMATKQEPEGPQRHANTKITPNSMPLG